MGASVDRRGVGQRGGSARARAGGLGGMHGRRPGSSMSVEPSGGARVLSCGRARAGGGFTATHKLADQEVKALASSAGVA